ncbi:MAG: hypothetical protein FVQ77_15250 [Cytophagales bacterium]|nr:hypothetical protein [Cytophagales bacterium]
MNFSIEAIPYFKKQAKRLTKKYPSLKQELDELGKRLSCNPKQGIPIGHNCYKIRLAIKSKGKGKSGGARIITHIVVIKEKVFLLSVYDKSDNENISDKEI